MPTRYRRLLCEEAEQSLLRGGPYGFLVSDIPMTPDDLCTLDVQIRENNKLMYYHGTTRLLVIRFSLTSGVVRVEATADKAYSKYPGCQSEYEALMRSWLPEESATLRSAFLAYLPKAISAANKQYYHNHKEGYWQNQLCVRFGKLWKPGDEWLIIDRECVLGFGDNNEKTTFFAPLREKYQAVRNGLQHDDAVKWGSPDGKALGDELDLMAINRQGQLSVIELKYGTNSRGIYWGPLQAGLYHQAFAETIEITLEWIKEMVRQKIRLGLLPKEANSLLESSDLRKVEPVLAIADPNEKSKCWKKMQEVIAKMDQAGIKRPLLPLRIAKIRLGFELQLKDAPYPDSTGGNMVNSSCKCTT